MRIEKPSVELVFITPNAEEIIEKVARTCYRSEGLIGPGTAVKLIRKLWNRKHMAMIEHAYATVKFVCDRGVSHEIVRHRVASFGQESTRYCNYSKDKFSNEIAVIQPPGLTGPIPGQTDLPCTFIAWEMACKHAEESYFHMLKKGLSPQIARSVLPPCLRTEIVMTANFREWIHFLTLRNDPAAHPQMVELAAQLEQMLVRERPRRVRSGRARAPAAEGDNQDLQVRR